MPRVHFVKTARKDNRAVKKGESYYWWKFRYGGKHMSKTQPRQSQLTQSKWSQVYEALEQIEDSCDVESLNEAIDNAQSILDDVSGEYEEAAEQFGGMGDNQERAERCQDLRGELDEFLERCQEEVDCPDCDSGSVDCEDCDDSGDVECSTCDGSGDNEDEEDEDGQVANCSDCGGEGKLDCESCGGDGSAPCESCSGNGTCELHEAPQEQQEEKFSEIQSEVLGLEWDSPC